MPIQISTWSTKPRQPLSGSKISNKSTRIPCKMKPTSSPNFPPVSGSERKKQGLRGANQGAHPPPPGELRPLPTLPALPPSPKAGPHPLLGSSRRGGGRAPPSPPTRVRSTPHGAAGLSVSAREEGERRRRRLRLRLALPLLLSPPPSPRAVRLRGGAGAILGAQFRPLPPAHSIFPTT